ncbi:YggN family protein [Pseudoalteromonas sp.]|uniref:YggN family protein n=1 Tax=unclassified Pseudoalteromonas TaxID=194690 RepID=UPI003F9BC0EA
MKKLLLISSLLITTSVMAHNDHDNNISFNGEQCDVEFHNDVRIKPNELEIFTSDNHTMKIVNDNQLYIDDQSITLNSEQRQAINDYSESLRSQLPEVADIALESVKIAGVAINEVAQAFNIEELDSIDKLMADIETKVNDTFYQQDDFVMGQQSFQKFGENFESDFEEQISAAVESAISQSMGSILMAVGSQMMDSGGDMKSFEQRMENMGTAIETKVEQQAKRLEKRADTLCSNFSVIAEQEQQLVTLLPELKSYSLFSYKQNTSKQ